jgi:hypothetical protein
MTSNKTQCPYIDKGTQIAIEKEGNHLFNYPIPYPCTDGTVYTFYYHFDGFDQYYNCQFCQLIGRKRDVFECLNQSEWQKCIHYLTVERIRND